MKILMLLNAPYPDDIRVRKEAEALAQAGVEIHLLCRKGKGEIKEEITNTIHIHRINAGRSNPQLALRDILISTLGYHPEFYSAAKKLHQSHGFDAIHVHDLPLTGTALRLKKDFPKIKVVADLHENYPEGLAVWHQWKKGFIVGLKNRLFMSPDKWRQLEKKFCQQSDHIIAVVEEMKEKLIVMHGIPSYKITVITNTESLSFLRQPDLPEVYASFRPSAIIAYCGGIGPHRGVDTVIRSMPLLSDLDVKFVIAGFGSRSVMEHLESLIKEMKLENRVFLLGKRPFSEFLSRMKYADIHVIPHSKNGHTDNTIPHKLFQGMMAGTPLLVSNVAPLKRTVEEVGSGLVFNADDPADCAKKIKELLSTNRETFTSKAIKATTEGSLNWENTGKTLAEMYLKLVEN